MSELRAEDRAHWQANGFLHLKGFFGAEEVAEVQAWTEDLAARPETAGKWMKYFESPAEGQRQLCRVEDFIPHHEGLAAFLVQARIVELLAELMGEPARLFKEKINFKLPGGQGFGAHQDAPAFTHFGQHFHITMLVPVDAATPENGCLEMVYGHHDKGLLKQTESGTIHPDAVATLEWRALPVSPGDVVFFDSYVPHRSGTNTTDSPRRALYITYNRASEGDARSAYYTHKRKVFPPECERDGWVPDAEAARIYNLGNPISTG